MTRPQAVAIVDAVTIHVQQFAAVPMASVRSLLGERTTLLQDDPIRRCGPTSDTVYPWNIVDYLTVDDPMGNKRRPAASRLPGIGD